MGHIVPNKQAGILVLAHIDAIGAEIIVIAVHQLDTGVLHAIHIISKTVVLVNPAVLTGIDQGILVLKLLIGGCVNAASFNRITFREVIGHQIEDLLIFFLHCEGVQGVGAQVDLVGNGAGVLHRETLLGTPFGIIPGRQLNPAEDAQGVGGGGVNGLGLVDPVHANSEGIGFLIQLNTILLQLEVVILDGQPGDINLHVWVKLDGECDLRSGIDALGQL